MAEIVFFVTDITHPTDFYKDCGLYKAGDVIEVLPDGWSYGVEELKNPNWRIIKFPGVAVDQFSHFLTPQQPSDPNRVSKTLLRRARRFAYDKINTTAAHPATITAFESYIADDTRANPTLTVPANVVAALMRELDKMTATKPLVADPTIVGDTPTNVIG